MTKEIVLSDSSGSIYSFELIDHHKKWRISRELFKTLRHVNKIKLRKLDYENAQQWARIFAREYPDYTEAVPILISSEQVFKFKFQEQSVDLDYLFRFLNTVKNLVSNRKSGPTECFDYRRLSRLATSDVSAFVTICLLLSLPLELRVPLEFGNYEVGSLNAERFTVEFGFVHYVFHLLPDAIFFLLFPKFLIRYFRVKDKYKQYLTLAKVFCDCLDDADILGVLL